MSYVILVNENDNIYEQLTNKGINYIKFKDNIKLLNNTIQNNNIGYFQIESENNFYKICILPKIINKKSSNLIEGFGTYINVIIGLIYKYNINNYKLPINNYSDIVDICRLGTVEKLDYLIHYKYGQALSYIEFFFKDYIKYSYKRNKFSDLSIIAKIDIKSNILEINKTKIHQIGKQEISYSQIADITISVLKYFDNFKTKQIHSNSQLKLKLYNVKRIINKKFAIKNFYYTMDRILSDKVAKLFNNPKLHQLYMSLLILLDLDGYFESNKGYSFINKIYNMPSIIINPSYIYEYFVYDYYCNRPEIYKDIRFMKVDKEERVIVKHLKRVTAQDEDLNYSNYSALNESKDQWIKKMDKLWISTKSEPDLVMKELNKNNIWYDIVSDCKWKILDKNIDNEDMNKLMRDCLARNVNRGKLIYPLITSKKYKSGDSFEVSDERFPEGIFYLTIEECKII